MSPSALEVIAAALFLAALVHTFSTGAFEHLARLRPAHAGFWHLLGEVEVVFGFWALVLVVVMVAHLGRDAATAYLDSRDFTEPMFVFAVMIVAGSRPVLAFARALVARACGALRLPGAMPFAFVALALLPLLGSVITEPAAMTVAALMLRDRLLGAAAASTRLKYATLGVLFVNVSIGGTLTPFAAPPVLMVATTWNWDLPYMLGHFGWRATLAVVVNAAAFTWLFRRELGALPRPVDPAAGAVPGWVTVVHLLFLAAIVAYAHHAPIFLGLLLFFIGFATAYPQHQDRLILREGLLVAFFLAGLVVLGGQQGWWLEPLLRDMDADTVFFGALLLTAVTDNAALTYLGSLVEGLDEPFRQALVAGAVTGGGLTVIANAPNPAGFAILRERFADRSIHPLGLAAAALLPTLVAALAFRIAREATVGTLVRDLHAGWTALPTHYVVLLALPLVVVLAGLAREAWIRWQARSVGVRADTGAAAGPTAPGSDP